MTNSQRIPAPSAADIFATIEREHPAPGRYADEAARFQARHGFPAPPEDLMANRAPFCGTCEDWHYANEEHSR